MRWYTDSDDLMFKAIVLEILVEMALMAVQNEQPVPPYLMRLCMCVKVL